MDEISPNEPRTEALLYDNLVSGDRPSVIAAGMVAAASLQKTRTAVLMVNVLGEVCIMPPESIQVLHRPLVNDETLNLMEEDDALQVMLSEERSEEEIIEYLKRREAFYAGQDL